VDKGIMPHRLESSYSGFQFAAAVAAAGFGGAFLQTYPMFEGLLLLMFINLLIAAIGVLKNETHDFRVKVFNEGLGKIIRLLVVISAYITQHYMKDVPQVSAIPMGTMAASFFMVETVLLLVKSSIESGLPLGFLQARLEHAMAKISGQTFLPVNRPAQSTPTERAEASEKTIEPPRD